MYGILEQFPEPVARKIFVDNAFPVTLIKQVSVQKQGGKVSGWVHLRAFKNTKGPR